MKHKETENYIEKINHYLIEKYSEIKPEWELLLSLLEDTYDEYLDMKALLEETGMFNPKTYKKNPLIASIKDARATINKMVQHFGISPYSDSKIKKLNEDDSTEDFIDSLTE
jgi:P27 family predicted phage terminase small subunit